MKKTFIIFLILSLSIYSATLKSKPVIHTPDYMTFEINAKSHEDAEALTEEILKAQLNVYYKNKYGTWWYWSQSKGVIITITKESDGYYVEVEKGDYNSFINQVESDKRY